ncbi:MAG: hypothetical protein AB7K09_03605 [Planctomycetota bacterium]
MAERFHSFGRVLRELGLEREELLRLIQQGFLRAFQDRKRLVFRKDDVIAFGRLRNEGVNFAGNATDDDLPPELPPDLRALGVSTDSDPASSIYESLPESAIRPRLGAILKRAQIISEGEIQEAIARQNEQRGRGELPQPIGEILVEAGYITETDVLNSLSVQNGLELLDLDTTSISRDAVRAVPLQVAEEFGVVPVRCEPLEGSNAGQRAIVVATSDPQNFRVADSLALVLGEAVRVVIASRTQIEQTRARIYAGVVPSALEPVRTPSGRLRIQKLDESLRLVARDASQALQRWYAEPGDPRFAPQLLGPRVFIAMPFARRFDPVADLVVTAINELGGRALRIDQVPNLRNIWVAIEREIARADVVIADFSGDVQVDVPNPNVVTEAAIAFHKYEKPVVVITQSTKGLFFDWRHQYALVYTLDREGMRRLGRGMSNRLAAEFNMFRPAEGVAAPGLRSADTLATGDEVEPDEPV